MILGFGFGFAVRSRGVIEIGARRPLSGAAWAAAEAALEVQGSSSGDLIRVRVRVRVRVIKEVSRMGITAVHDYARYPHPPPHPQPRPLARGDALYTNLPPRPEARGRGVGPAQGGWQHVSWRLDRVSVRVSVRVRVGVRFKVGVGVGVRVGV